MPIAFLKLPTPRGPEYLCYEHRALGWMGQREWDVHNVLHRKALA